MTNTIVKSNLAKMLGNDECGMMGLLMEESFGGNADCYEINGVSYPCGGTNFHYKGDGEILRFTNDPLSNFNLLAGTFRVAVNLKRREEKREENGFDKKIVETFLDKRTPEEARTNIGESVRLFNEIYDKA